MELVGLAYNNTTEVPHSHLLPTVGPTKSEGHSPLNTSESEEITPLKDIPVPSSFLLPTFTPQPPVKVDKLDIFKTNYRTVEQIWMDYVRIYVRDADEQPASDA